MQCLAVPPTLVGLTLVTCPGLPACTLNPKKENNSDKLWTAYTLIKLGDNLTNTDKDILIDIADST